MEIAFFVPMQSRISQLRQAVSAEKQATDEAFNQQLKLSPAEQRKQGILLFPLTITSQETSGMQTLVSFRTSFPISDAYFRKGCSVRYKQENHSGEGRLQELDLYTGVFSIYEEDVPNLRDEPVTLQLIPDDRTLKCMEIGARLAGESPQLEEFQRDMQSPLPDFEPTGISDLNERQQKACSAIVSDKPTVLIQGPPGTGKTHTLSIAIRELVARKKRVIISAPSNTAVDNLCHQLLDLDIPLLRVGNEEKMSPQVDSYTIDGYLERGSGKKVLEHLRKELRKADDLANKHIRNFTREAADEKREARKERTNLRREIRKTMQDAKQHLLNTIPVIAGTPVGLFNELPKEFLADVVIVDEAGQSLEPLTWLTASFGKRLVLCGDPQQLPPVVFSHEAKQLGLHRSLLESVMNGENTLILNEQYRMAPEIVAGINPYFYNDELETVFKERTGELRFIDMAGYGEGEQQDETSGSTYHPDEVRVVSKIIGAFNLSPKETIVLSPYNAQLGYLKEELGSDWRVSTIDAIQGQEERNIVISLTRSNPDQEIGFLKDYRRTNVAITRAKTRCFLVGDSSTLGADVFYGNLIDFIETNGGYQSAWEFEN